MIVEMPRALRLKAAVLVAAGAALPCATSATSQSPASASAATTAPPPNITLVPEPLPRQHQPLPPAPAPRAAGRSHPPIAPRDRVGAANDAARVEPERSAFVNAIQQYIYTEGALYQIYARPGQVTDIALQRGERLVGPGPVAAGDTARWLIGDTLSGAGESQRVHILVKPVRPDIMTNLVINTDRRTYHVELRANPSVYMASVSWTYPQDELIALRKDREQAERSAPLAARLDLTALDFRYRIEGDRPGWRPLRAFDDGKRVFIEFPDTIAQGELPPLFRLGAKGEAELVNYRVAGRYIIVDQLFATAELRLGDRKGAQKVRIIAGRRGEP